MLTMQNLVGFGAGGFTAVTHTFTSGTGASEPVPLGATQCVITGYGAGGGGEVGSGGGGGQGGGGGARVILTKAVLPAEWGANLTYTVGVGGAASGDGTDTTVTGTLNGGAIAPIAGGGSRGGIGTNRGTASGGDTNTSGSSGANHVGANGGDGGDAGPGGGTGGPGAVGGSGLPGTVGVAPGGGGGGGGSGPNTAGGAGAAGQISFAWT